MRDSPPTTAELVVRDCHVYILAMQTALHIKALVSRMKQQLVGGSITGTAFYKKERTAYFHVRIAKEKLTLGFVYHPRGFGTFMVKSSKVRITTREKPWPIFSMEGALITDVEQIGLDRLFRVELDQDAKKTTLMFEALGPNGNIWLLDDQNGRLATLRNRDFKQGDIYTAPKPPNKLNPFDQTATQLLDQFKDNPLSKFSLSKALLGFTPNLAAEAIARAEINADQFNSTMAEKLSAAITRIAQQFIETEKGYLFRMPIIEVYPMKLSTVDLAPEKFKTLSQAVLEMVTSRQSDAGQVDEEKRVQLAIAKSIKKMQKRIANVSDDISKAADYETYRLFGELLQISHDRLKRGMESITVDNIYADTPVKITITLDPALTPNGNIELYFKRHRKGREGLSLLQRRLEISNSELEQLRTIEGELQNNFESASQQYAAEIASLLPRESTRRETEQRLPYREQTLSTGVTVFIGREGADNDRTTFEFARPYELWFHTQQCPGSHVVMKFPNKSFEPSKREIEETAAFAAWHSKARKNSLVPVIYTQKRYVRKPRKAKPGLVTVEREKSLMVAPIKPE